MYAEMQDRTLKVFFNWIDYERFMNGEVVGTRYNGEAKIEFTAYGKKAINLQKKVLWKSADKVKKLGNNDYCIEFPRSEAAIAFVQCHSFEFTEPDTGNILQVCIYWSSWTKSGYHTDIEQTNYGTAA